VRKKKDARKGGTEKTDWGNETLLDEKQRGQDASGYQQNAL